MQLAEGVIFLICCKCPSAGSSSGLTIIIAVSVPLFHRPWSAPQQSENNHSLSRQKVHAASTFCLLERKTTKTNFASTSLLTINFENHCNVSRSSFRRRFWETVKISFVYGWQFPSALNNRFEVRALFLRTNRVIDSKVFLAVS